MSSSSRAPVFFEVANVIDVTSCCICLSLGIDLSVDCWDKISLGSTAESILAAVVRLACEWLSGVLCCDRAVDRLCPRVCVCVCFARGAAQLCPSLNTQAHRLDKVFWSARAHRRVPRCRLAGHLCGCPVEGHSRAFLHLDRQTV